MKTIYQLKPNDKNRNRLENKKLKLGISLIILFFVLFASSSDFSGTASVVLDPFFRVGNFIYEKIPFVPDFFRDRKFLIEKNRELFERVENLNLDLISYETILEENKRLYSELGLRPEGSFLGSKIIAKPPQVPTDSIVIDRGSGDVIDVGDIVLAGSRIMIGRVVSVSDKNAVVALSSLSNTLSYGYIERTGEAIDLEGVGGGSMRARVPIDFDIKLEDKVLIEGTRVYVAAIAASIEVDQSSGFEEILFKLPANIGRARVVFVEPSLVIESAN